MNERISNVTIEGWQFNPLGPSEPAPAWVKAMLEETAKDPLCFDKSPSPHLAEFRVTPERGRAMGPGSEFFGDPVIRIDSVGNTSYAKAGDWICKLGDVRFVMPDANWKMLKVEALPNG